MRKDEYLLERILFMLKKSQIHTFLNIFIIIMQLKSKLIYF